MNQNTIPLVYDYLSVKDMLNASATCKYWRRALFSLQRYHFTPLKVYGLMDYSWVNSVTIANGMNYQALIKFRHCKRVCLNWVSDGALKMLFCKNDSLIDSKVEELEINGGGVIADNSWRFAKNLKKLTLDVFFLRERDLKHLENLEEFSLFTRTTMYPTCRWLKYLKNVKSVDIRAFNISECGLEHLENCKRFALEGTVNSEDYVHLKNATHITLQTDNLYRLDHFKNVVYLDICGYQLISWCYLEHLRVLKVDDCDFLNDSHFRNFEKLEEIELWNCPNVSDFEHLWNVKIAKFSRLRVGNYAISKLKSVRNIWMENMPNIDNGCLIYLENCPVIKIL